MPHPSQATEFGKGPQVTSNTLRMSSIDRERKGWEDQILNDLERRDNSSIRSDGTAGPKKRTIFVSPLKFIFDLYLTVCYRLKLFTLTMVIVGLALYSRGDFGTQRKEMGLSALQWCALVGVLFAVDMLTTLVDHLFFYCLESLWLGSYEFVYYMYSWHGPLGHLLTVAVVVNFLPATHIAVQPYIDIRRCIATLIVIILLYTLKSYLIRVNYTRLLELRLKSRLDVIELWAGVISDLACDKSASTTGTDFSPEKEETMSPMQIDVCLSRPTTTSPVNGKANGVVADDNWSRERGVSDSVEPSRRDSDASKQRKRVQSFQSSKIRNLSELKDSTAHNEDYEGVEEVEGDSAREFWNRLKALKSGSLHITTNNGPVLLDRRKQAIEFGKYLYQYLLAEAEDTCDDASPPMITKMSLLDKIDKGSRGKGMLRKTKHGGYNSRSALTMELFRVAAMGSDECITEAKIIGAVVRAFKAFKFASASLHDLKALHKSVLIIVDIIFWLFMFLLAQVILEINTTKAIAPVLTVVFGLSFAFGPAVSNVFLAMVFVMFMLPFDVGNRVCIGKEQSTGIIGNILSIDLLYTTILTRFNEKIINLYESTASTFRFNFEFCLAGEHAVSIETIREFFSRVDHFWKHEQKGQWVDLIIFNEGYNNVENTIKYVMWATCSVGWQEIAQVFAARGDLMDKMRTIQNDLGIQFMKLTEPIHVTGVGDVTTQSGQAHSAFDGFEDFVNK